jgi:hypothetical protein
VERLAAARRWIRGLTSRAKQRSTNAVEVLPRQRQTVVIAGLTLVLIPTLFSVFPAWTTWPLGVLIAIVVVWLASALIVVLGTARQAGQLDRLVGPPLARQQQQREYAGARLLRAVLTDSSGFPDHYELPSRGRNAVKNAREQVIAVLTAASKVDNGALGVGFEIAEVQRSKWGIVERLRAHKPG